MPAHNILYVVLEDFGTAASPTFAGGRSVPGGALPKRFIGEGGQLYVRTAQHAYTAYLGPPCSASCVRGFELVDETLFDHAADPAERVNRAYSREPAHVAARSELLRLVLRDWNLSVVGQPAPWLVPPDRAARTALVARLAGCFKGSLSARCTGPLGPLSG